jgi:hypothetical protein
MGHYDVHCSINNGWRGITGRVSHLILGQQIREMEVRIVLWGTAEICAGMKFIYS